MSCILDQLIFVAIGAFISFLGKVVRISPIPIIIEIMAVLIALGMVWLTNHYFEGFYSMSFGEQVRLLVIGYLPIRIVKSPRRENNE